MGKLIFAVVVFVVGFAVYSALKRQTLLTGPMAVIAARLVLAFTIGIPLLIVLFSVFRIIPAGHVGVKVLFGQVEQQPLREGLNVVLNPLYDVVDMDVRVVKHAARYDAASKDLQAVHVEMVLNYRVMPDRAPEVYRNIGPNFSSVIIDPAAQEVLKANTATHNAEEILLQRPQIKADVQRDLTAWLAKYGLEMKEAALANIRFDPAYEKAVESKQIEQQKAEQKRYDLLVKNPELAPKKAELTEKVAAHFQARFNDGVDTVLTAKEQVRRLLEGIRWIRGLFFAIAGVLLASSLFLIVNTIRLATFARRREIQVMKLVGATNWFIRVPFMFEGLIQGAIGAGLAFAGVYALRVILSDLVDRSKNLFSAFYVTGGDAVAIGLLIVAVGATVGAMGSAIGLRRFLDA